MTDGYDIEVVGVACHSRGFYSIPLEWQGALPFVPFAGLRLQFRSVGKDDPLELVVSEVYWLTEENRFSLRCDDVIVAPHTTAEEARAWLIASGVEV